MTQIEPDQPKAGGIQAVEFALRILEFVAQHRGSVGVSELSRAFDTNKSRIHRHLQTLVAAGYLVRDDATERYAVSARLVALGQAVSENFELTSAARSAARDLRDQTRHAVSLGQPERDGVRILMVLASRADIEIAVKPGSLLNMHASAQGKVALAFGDPAVLQTLRAQSLSMITPYTILDHDRLAAEVDATRRRGWATAANEAMVGINALAAPIFDALGRFVGTIAITDSVQFIGETPSVEQVEAVQAAARQISQELGARSEPRR